MKTFKEKRLGKSNYKGAGNQTKAEATPIQAMFGNKKKKKQTKEEANALKDEWAQLNTLGAQTDFADQRLNLVDYHPDRFGKTLRQIRSDDREIELTTGIKKYADQWVGVDVKRKQKVDDEGKVVGLTDEESDKFVYKQKPRPTGRKSAAEKDAERKKKEEERISRTTKKKRTRKEACS
ncbi:hypothetical protein [Aureibacter tunicatorum]|uniref:Uncharacterized protein n=1 Tax=Aureibacter tunicatorum TaxID=866807 RepID=A0AAE4BSD6_9BACT|nr:hypothetical protein [Aureibacter tunicatorum]MDR6238272.1 hypothetical protein [Aureibacter tunicatorum]BDD03305.1 hypothetical protein AUTU_07880 [Aureibacter tunicatorum]